MRGVRPVLRIRAPSGGRIGTWLALLALLVNVIGPLALAGRSAAGGLAMAPEALVVCSGGGLKVIALDGDHSPVRRADDAGTCVFCLPLVGGGAGVPKVAVVLVEIGEPSPVPRLSTAWAPPRTFPPRKPTHSRGPPVLV